ncbi:Outer membrane efflux protein [Hydrogenophaga sp. T4]|nr:Outer membrane efflux protein [Hydrogenophaga sp. T4]
MNVLPGADFVLAEAVETNLPVAPKDIGKLEEMALLQRPELREEDYRKRISADEARKQILGMLPGITLNYGRQHDSNRLLYNNSWSEGGLSLAWNLMRLVALPSMKNAQQYQQQTDEARRMALSMAILTQTRVSAERYRMALEDFRLADQAAQVDTRLAAFTKRRSPPSWKANSKRSAPRPVPCWAPTSAPTPTPTPTSRSAACTTRWVSIRSPTTSKPTIWARCRSG